MVMLGSHADPTGVGLAGLELRLGHLLRRCLLWWLQSADGALPMAEFDPKYAILGRVGSVVVYVAGRWSGCGS